MKNSKKCRNPISKYKLLSSLMENVPDVIYFKDRKGKLLMVNHAHAKGLGLRPEEVVGKTDYDFFPRKRAEMMAKDDEHVMRTGKAIIDKIERATRADGVDNYVSTTKIPRYDGKGEVIGLVGITRDITHRMQIEGLKEEKRKIEKRLEEMDDLNKIRSEFVSIVSHELRTPLAIIKEAVMLIYDGLAGNVTEKQAELLVKAKDNIERIRRIIEDLLDISRIERGRLELHYSLVNLNDLLRDSSEFFRNMALQKKIDLKYDVPCEQINVFVDAERTCQIISNLINNAVKFTEQNGSIKVEAKVMDTDVRVGVIDTGIGIPKRDLPKLFNKYVQVSKIHNTEKKGIGLGLAIAKELAEKHGGRIWAESKAGSGSKFYFTLPKFYTSSVLDKNIRDKINGLLEKNTAVYLINVSIINFVEFQNKMNLVPKKMLDGIKVIIDTVFREFLETEGEKPQIVFQDYKSGVFSIIFPEATEEKAALFCEIFKNRINSYFSMGETENIFVNIGIASYPSEDGVLTTQKLLANLYVKRIFIGPELRRYKRISYKADIEAVSQKEGAESLQTIDLSEGGICFAGKRRLKKGAQITVKLNLPKKNPFCFNGRVAWIKKIDSHGQLECNYKTGVEFVNLKKEEKRNLAGLIKSISV